MVCLRNAQGFCWSGISMRGLEAGDIAERHLRPSAIFREATKGFRCEWGAEAYAAFRSVGSTAKADGASVLETVRFVLDANLPTEPMLARG